MDIEAGEELNKGKVNIAELLEYIDPASLNYQEWIDVGFALKTEGYDVSVWDDWSRKDYTRYHEGETLQKWSTFEGEGVTGATITQMAKDNGWVPRSQRAGQPLDWDSPITNELVVVDQGWVEDVEVKEPTNWNPKQQLIDYLSTLFDSDDYVGYVTETWERVNDHTGEVKHMPSKGVYSKTAGQIIEELGRYDDMGYAIGDHNEEAGAWIRFNPLDGQGVNNSNVTDYRYALVESDDMEIERQHALLLELELPIAVLVHSGGKSLHAIVKIDAANLNEYKERVNRLYDVCDMNGFRVDRQNKNPSRLSRLPGVTRNGHKQFIVAKNIGKQSWEEWDEWIEDVNDDLPDPESLAEVWENMPDKNPELIEGILRQGHKMLIAGPSKAGKSLILIGLASAIAEGREWLGYKVAQGKVLYVNLEIDAASGYHRFKDVYHALGYPPANLENIDIWNLRGKTTPMDKLAPKLIRRAEKRGYIAVIIDPIYKVLTGDENSAEDMAKFTNQFDKIASSLNCAVIYVHHHSKGAQGGKSSVDRASGSGVFARDPDAILDLIELELTDAMLTQQANQAVCQVYRRWFDQYDPGYAQRWISQDDWLSVTQMDNHAKESTVLRAYSNELAIETIQAAEHAKKRTAWRVEATLREFAKPEPRDIFFDYPIHTVDDLGVLKLAQPASEQAPWQKKGTKSKSKKDSSEDRKAQRVEALETTFSELSEDGQLEIEELAETMGISERTVRRHIKESGKFTIKDGYVFEQ